MMMPNTSSGSKWSLFGGMREAAQMVSYEIPLAICALIPIVAAGSLNLGEIGNMQGGHAFNWFLFHDPFTFVAFFVYFVVATASCKRAPFDLAEAESELVGGFHTEYSGMRWSFFFMGEYASMFAVCGVASILFLGGWHTGLPFLDFELAALRAEGEFSAGGYLANVLGAFVFITKAAFLVFVQIWVRWTLPRLRIDQVMITCLKYLVPISCALFLGATIWPIAWMQITASGDVATTAPFQEPLGPRVVESLPAVERSSEPVGPALTPSAPEEPENNESESSSGEESVKVKDSEDVSVSALSPEVR